MKHCIGCTKYNIGWGFVQTLLWEPTAFPLTL